MNKDKMLNVISEVKKSKPTGFNAMECTEFHNKNYSYIDWHEYSNFLDVLNNNGFIHCVGHNRDSMTIYDF